MKTTLALIHRLETCARIEDLDLHHKRLDTAAIADVWRSEVGEILELRQQCSVIMNRE